jgi:hypothetical protein
LSFAACATPELQRSEVAQRLMRAHGVVDAHPGAGLAVEGGDTKIAERADLIELLGMGGSKRDDTIRIDRCFFVLDDSDGLAARKPAAAQVRSPALIARRQALHSRDEVPFEWGAAKNLLPGK